jgi:hypothetical protein
MRRGEVPFEAEAFGRLRHASKASWPE